MNAAVSQMTTYSAARTSPTEPSEERNSSASGSDGEHDDENGDTTLENGSPSKKRKRSLKIS